MNYDSFWYYLIRNDSTNKMAGFCFIDNNQAVVEKISFSADSIGTITFIYADDVYSGKMFIKQSSKEIELILPKTSALKISKQTIYLNYFSTVSAKADCHER